MYFMNPPTFDGDAIDKEYLEIIRLRQKYQEAVASGIYQSMWPMFPRLYSADEEESPRTNVGRDWRDALTEDRRNDPPKMPSTHYHATRPEAAGLVREIAPKVYVRMDGVK